MISGLLLSLALVLLIGTGVDFARAFILRRDLTAIADDAALAGSQQLDLDAWRQGTLALDPGQAEQAAEAELAANPGISGAAQAQAERGHGRGQRSSFPTLVLRLVGIPELHGHRDRQREPGEAVSSEPPPGALARTWLLRATIALAAVALLASRRPALRRSLLPSSRPRQRKPAGCSSCSAWVVLLLISVALAWPCGPAAACASRARSSPKPLRLQLAAGRWPPLLVLPSPELLPLFAAPRPTLHIRPAGAGCESAEMTRPQRIELAPRPTRPAR